MYLGQNDEQSGVIAEVPAMQSLQLALEAASLAENRLREAIEALPHGIVFLDDDHRYVLWNRKYAEIYEKSADLLEPGRSMAEALRIGVERGDYPEASGREDEWVAERVARLREPGMRHEQWLSNGRCIMIEERRIAGGGIVGIRVDITDFKRNEEIFRPLFERNPLPMFVHDRETAQIRGANEASGALFGYAPEDMVGLPASCLFPADTWPEIQALLATDSSDIQGCWQMLGRDGSIIEAAISTRLSFMHGRAGTIVSVFDVTERRRIERRMAYMARHDELTGLANRAHCHEHLREVLASAGASEAVTLALVDLDHFKPVNDTYGHMFGDAVLSETARRMSALVPAGALLCRIGGDEFAIILRRTSLTQAELIARSVIAALSEPFVVQGNAIHMGATIGFASSPYDSRDAETLLRYADLALYAAKNERRGSCRYFEASMDEAAQEKSRLEQDLRAAVQAEVLEVYYQPIVNLASGALECQEALLRWNHPQRGAVPPDVFVPLAEEMGLIDQLGRFVLERACRQAMCWPDHVKVSVNVSPLQLRNGHLLNTVTGALAAAGLPPERLELEITEAVLMEKGPRPAAILRNLRALGIGLALDDFGTGYSSLSYLLNYPFTKIKIDKSFTLNLHQEANSRAVVRAVIGLGRSLGLTIAAEGIEREIERDYLRAEGCTQGQGYLFGKPQPPAACEDCTTTAA